MKQFRRKKRLGMLIFLLAFAAVIAVVMLLWNALLPEIFGIASINYWQSAGLLILSRLLFGGFGKFHPGGFHGMHHQKKEKLMDLHDKIQGMSHDERREFIRKRMTGWDEEDEKK
jgi:hypothetical protein